MRVNKRLLLVAVILGLITVIALNSYLKGMASEGQAASAVAYKEVVTAKNTIPEYTRITAEMLTMQSVPVDAVHPEALTDINDAVGGITSSEIIKDEQVLASRVVTE